MECGHSQSHLHSENSSELQPFWMPKGDRESAAFTNAKKCISCSPRHRLAGRPWRGTYPIFCMKARAFIFLKALWIHSWPKKHKAFFPSWGSSKANETFTLQHFPTVCDVPEKIAGHDRWTSSWEQIEARMMENNIPAELCLSSCVWSVWKIHSKCQCNVACGNSICVPYWILTAV